MTEISALRLPLQDLRPLARLAPAAEPAVLRVALPASGPALTCGSPSTRTVVLRRPELVADLRRARAERFASRYEWLALRRRRAQIAARHALGD